MANTSFLLKNPKGKDQSLIYLVVTFNYNRLRFSTKEKVKVKYWDKKKQRVKSVLNYPYKEINNRLNIIEEEVINIIETSKPLTAGTLKEKIYNYLNDISETPTELISFFELFILNSKNRINTTTGKRLSDKTILSYTGTLKLLKEFNKDVRKVDFDSIDMEFYDKFTSYLQDVYDFNTNTIGKQIKNLKTVLNNAVEKGVNTNLKYKNRAFKIVTEYTDKIYLNENELQQIIDLDLTENIRLERARDLFILGCYTGLRYSDYSRLTKNDITIKENRKMFKIRAKKTDNTVIIPILPQAQNIIDKYEKLPTLSNQKLNLYIKEVCKLVPSLNEKIIQTSTKNGLRVNKKIEKYKLVSTHTARRSFATNMYKRGIPAQNIMAITGHKTEKMFFTYIRATQDERVLDFVRAFENSNKLKIVNNGN